MRLTTKLWSGINICVLNQTSNAFVLKYRFDFSSSKVVIKQNIPAKDKETWGRIAEVLLDPNYHEKEVDFMVSQITRVNAMVHFY